MKKINILFLILFASLSIKAQETKPSSTGTVGSESGNPEFYKNDKKYLDRAKITKPLMPNYGESQLFNTASKKSKKQQEAYLAGNYYYPAKPKSKWELGASLGSYLLSGDVAPVLNPLKSYGFSAHVRKDFGYVYSLRLQYLYGQATGQDWKMKSNLSQNPVLNGSTNPLTDYLHGTTGNAYFHNYRMYSNSLLLQNVFTLTNLRYHKERTKLNCYAMLGIGGLTFKTKIDALDGNNKMYNYTKADSIWTNKKFSGDIYSTDREVKKAILDELKGIQDGTYETVAEHESDGIQLFGQQLLPTYNVGLGLSARLAKWLNLNFEVQSIRPFQSDLLDGSRWQEDRGGLNPSPVSFLTRDFDNLWYTSLGLAVNVGGKKSTEPLYWLNPMDYTYKKMAAMDPDKVMNDFAVDTDEDGVPDKLDKELNTKKGCPVDARGVALDSDKDGLKDCDDKEPYSPPGFPIDDKGVAIVPPPACCQNMKSGHSGGAVCDAITLPSTYYSKDKYGVRPEYIPVLHIVGEKMQSCPDAKIVVSGVNDKNKDPKYGEQLSWNRANDAINYLVEKYGISRDRFIMKYNAAGSGNKEKDRRVDFKFATEGETGDSNPPAPHPGLKAGSKE